MLKLLLFIGFLVSTNTYPLKEYQEVTSIDTNKEMEDLKRILDDVSYVNKFKNMMAEYVKTQYKELTHHDMEKIEDYLEDFCHNFAKDLKDIIENDNFKEMYEIDDGLPDTTFEEVKSCLKNELPNIKEETVDQVTFSLRKNIFITRQKIDQVIRESQRAAVENS